MVSEQSVSNAEVQAASAFEQLAINLGFNPANYERCLGKEGLCQVRTVNGQSSLYLADGTKIPHQLDISLKQPLDMALSSPRVAHVTIKVLATIVDSMPMNEQDEPQCRTSVNT